MRRFAFAIALGAAACAPAVLGAARADAAEALGCALNPSLALADQQVVATIACPGVSDAVAGQLAEILNRTVQNRLDPQAVLAKLEEVERVPEEGVARALDEAQRQRILQALAGKPGQLIAVLAHPQVEDGIDYAKALATPLIMAGWQIEGHQIRRIAPKPLDGVTGVALVVRNKDAAPAKAHQLKATLAAVRVVAPLVTEPTLAEDAVMLWVGRRPVFTAPEKP